MPLIPYNFSYIGDLYRFLIDFSDKSKPVLRRVIRYDDGRANHTSLKWSDLPVAVAESFIDKYPSCDIGNIEVSTGIT